MGGVMSWFSKKSSQDYGDYLPDDEATLQKESIPIQADSRKEAEENCQEEAKAYDGFEAKVEKVEGSDKDYDCHFKF